jgi:membrane-associated protease RseP (regulator of RpoE activity)
MYPESTYAAQQREELRSIAAEVMDVQQVQHVPPEEQGIIKVTGPLRQEPQAAYEHLAPRCSARGYTALLQEDSAGAALVAVPGGITVNPSRLWLALLLFGLTIASTVFVGGLDIAGFNLGLGLAYSASILSILLAHELGHFLTARRLGVAVSYPFFIPVPLPPLGTMGAFIAMKQPPPDRRALLAIAIAGPVAGLVVAIPVLILGLLLSEVQPLGSVAGIEEGGAVLLEGNSLLYAAIKIGVFGRFLPSGGEDVLLHPVAWAGWVGLLVTGLNLIPAGQLDGGHIFYALFGARVARIATWAMAGLLLVLGFLYWPGWFLWATLIIVFGQQRAPLLNELVTLDARQRVIAALGLVIFILVFTPTPLRVVPLQELLSM